jgi:hypothetical protein
VVVIHISREQALEIEYLIAQAIQGNHVLFDSETIRKVFINSKGDVSQDESYQVEHHIERLLSLPHLDQKRAYLDSLEKSVFQNVVKTYFHIVENNLYENLDTKKDLQ